MKHIVIAAIVVESLAGCATPRPADISLDEAVAAAIVPELPPISDLIEMPILFPPSPQPKAPLATAKAPAELRDPAERIKRANEAARVEPSRDQFVNAMLVWPYSEDVLYQVYASPERVTDIALEVGETLISVSAADSVRWVLGDTISGSGESERVHIHVKPIREGLNTNLVIHSDRRSYHLELTSTTKTWMASIAWSYPLDALRVRQQARERKNLATPIAEDVAIDRLNFRYEVEGDKVSWRPLRAFDDGVRVYIQFPVGIAQGEMPPLFVLGAQGDTQLVNYRVRAPYYIVDRLFNAAELRLGGHRPAKVRILRSDARKAASRAGGS